MERPRRVLAKRARPKKVRPKRVQRKRVRPKKVERPKRVVAAREVVCGVEARAKKAVVVPRKRVPRRRLLKRVLRKRVEKDAIPGLLVFT